MAAAITKAVAKTMPIQDTVAIKPMNTEDLLVVTLVVTVLVVETVKMLILFAANSKTKVNAVVLITVHVTGMIVKAATAINSFVVVRG